MTDQDDLEKENEWKDMHKDKTMHIYQTYSEIHPRVSIYLHT